MKREISLSTTHTHTRARSHARTQAGMDAHTYILILFRCKIDYYVRMNINVDWLVDRLIDSVVLWMLLCALSLLKKATLPFWSLLSLYHHSIIIISIIFIIVLEFMSLYNYCYRYAFFLKQYQHHRYYSYCPVPLLILSSSSSSSFLLRRRRRLLLLLPLIWPSRLTGR